MKLAFFVEVEDSDIQAEIEKLLDLRKIFIDAADILGYSRCQIMTSSRLIDTVNADPEEGMCTSHELVADFLAGRV